MFKVESAFFCLTAFGDIKCRIKFYQSQFFYKEERVNSRAFYDSSS